MTGESSTPAALIRLRALNAPTLLELREILTALLEEPAIEKLITRDDWLKIAMPMASISGQATGAYAAKIAMGERQPDTREAELAKEKSTKLREFMIGLDAGRPVRSSLRYGLDLLDVVERYMQLINQ